MDEKKQMSKRERLQELDEAISNILVGGQRYKIANRELERARLYDLRLMRKELKAEVEEEDAEDGLLGGVFVANMEPR